MGGGRRWADPEKGAGVLGGGGAWILIIDYKSLGDQNCFGRMPKKKKKTESFGGKEVPPPSRRNARQQRGDEDEPAPDPGHETHGLGEEGEAEEGSPQGL